MVSYRSALSFVALGADPCLKGLCHLCAMVSFVAMFWKIRFANDPLALKAAEDARIDRAAPKATA